jgi:hypothetical protein
MLLIIKNYRSDQLPNGHFLLVYPLFGQILSTKLSGPPNFLVKTKPKELKHFWFRLVEEKIHHVSKMRF